MNTKNTFLLSMASMALTSGVAWADAAPQSGNITFQLENITNNSFRGSITLEQANMGSYTNNVADVSLSIGSNDIPGVSSGFSDYARFDAAYTNGQSETIDRLVDATSGLTSLQSHSGGFWWIATLQDYMSSFTVSASDTTFFGHGTYNGTSSIQGIGTIAEEDYETIEIALHGGGTLTIILGPEGYVRLSGLTALDKSNLETMVQSNQVYVMRGVTSTLNGSHHRLLMDSSLNKDGWHTWVTGDFAGDQATDSAFASGEVGASRSVGSDDVRVGLGIGHMNASADGMFGSTSNLKGQYLVGEVDYRVRENVILSALAYYGASRATSHRNAADGSYTADGKTDVSSFAGRLRADWKNAFQAGDVSFTPRAAYTYIGSTVDAYTETGAGANNVSLEKQDRSAHEFRAGLDADYLLNEKTLLRGILEVAHLNGDNETVRGSTDSDSFTLPSDDSASKDTWARLGIEAVRQVSDSANIHASIFRSTEGYDATVSGAIGMNFWF